VFGALFLSTSCPTIVVEHASTNTAPQASIGFIRNLFLSVKVLSLG
jgi:hypothetical protein